MADQLKDAQAVKDAFSNCRVKHAHLDAAIDRVNFHLLRTRGTHIVAVVGPSGIGKSLLIEAVQRAVQLKYAEDIAARPHIRPFIKTPAKDTGANRFGWDAMYRTTLRALGDPFADKRHFRRAHDGDVDNPIPINGSSGLGTLRDRLQHELRLRENFIWCIDEAQHAVSKVRGKGLPPERELDVFKSVANDAGSKLLMVGPPELARYLTSSDQFSRRSDVVFIPRYRMERPEDRKEFGRVAQTFFSRMEIAGTPTLREAEHVLYLGSLGCIGVLKEWMERALARCLDRCPEPSRAVLTLDDLRSTRKSTAAIRDMTKAIQEMELLMSVDTSDEAYEAIVFGTPAMVPKSASKEAAVTTRKRSQTSKPGVRSPVRDALGADTVWARQE